VQIRLEVYNSTGKKLFDIEVRSGNVLDWHLQDGQAEALTDDAYLCVITVKSLSGKLTQRIGSVNIEKLSASVQPIDASQITSQQSQAIGPVEENASLTVLKEDDNNTTTIIAHDGQDGQITRGRGALSFRIGDFFSGKDSEQMRLTAEGNLGIGIAHPQARLDVDGLIRTTQGIIFPDGSIQTTAAIADSSQQTPGVKLQGQQGSVNQASSKAGKVGKGQKQVSPEFNVNEDLTVNGNIIFTPQISRDITMQNNNGGLRFYGAPSLTGSPAAAAIQFWGNNSGFPGQLYLDSGAHDSGAIILRTTGTGGSITERLRVTATGNVGIGTSAPNSKLTVWTPGASGIQEGIRINNPVGFSGVENGSSLVFSQDRSTSENFVNATIKGGQEIANSSEKGFLAFSTKFGSNPPSEKMRITGDGNVGIGTISPQAKLDVRGELDVRGDVKLGGTGSLFAPGGEEKLRIIRGVIGESGDILEGAGFTVSHPQKGQYVISFQNFFAGVPAVMATANSNSEFLFVMTETGAVNLAILDVFSITNGGLSDARVHFIAIGPR
jgi:hypothetical protein